MISISTITMSAMLDNVLKMLLKRQVCWQMFYGMIQCDVAKVECLAKAAAVLHITICNKKSQNLEIVVILMERRHRDCGVKLFQVLSTCTELPQMLSPLTLVPTTPQEMRGLFVTVFVAYLTPLAL